MAPKRPSPLENPPSASPSSEEEELQELSDNEQDQEQGQKQNPNAPDSEDEEGEEFSSSEDNDGGEGDENEETETTNPSAGKPAMQQPHSSSESESRSDSYTDSGETAPSPTASDFTVKPSLSKPMGNSANAKKAAPDPNPSAVASKGSRKRTADTKPTKVDGKELPQKKGRFSNGTIEEKKSPIRLWSEEDKISILRGMIEYRTKKGMDPYADMTAFHDFIKKSLHVQVTKNQLMDKIRRLKKKFQTYAEKDEDPVFSKPNDIESFQLSKKIWGVGGVAADGNAVKSRSKKAKKSIIVTDSVPKEGGREVAMKDRSKGIIETIGGSSNKRVKNSVESKKPKALAKENLKEVDATERLGAEGDVLRVDDEGFWSKHPRLEGSLELEKFGSLSSAGKKALKDELGKIGREKATGLEEKWQDFRELEVEMHLKWLDLQREQANMVLESMRSSRKP